MLQTLKQVFRKQTVKEIALAELEDAQKRVLSHQAATKYHAKMTEYFQDTITRLQTYVSKT